MFKKHLAMVLILALTLMAILTAGCAPTSVSTSHLNDSDLKIITSFLPIYIFTANLTAGIDGISLNNLAAPDVGCLHDYSLLPGDMVKLEEADIFIFNGAGMESYLNQLAELGNDMITIEASQGIELLPAAGNENNGHVWLSVPLAIRQVRNISAGLQQADPARKSQYQTNEVAYINRLEALDADFRNGLADLKHWDIITFHEAFPYLAREYGLTVAGVIEREPGSEPSASELAETIDLIKSKGISALFAEPQYSTRVAETIAAETGAKIYTLDPIVTGAADAATYEQKMRQNLAVLQEALGG
ncbi:MAG TPA: zinc ABC transporter substrate-binding protein [Clostridiales bacterium]|nr:zinc ABC transporter substrate-binding protein [Clostridiales bacterium]